MRSGNKKQKKERKNSLIRTAVYVLYVTLLVFAGLEIALRIYNPFHFRLKGERIILPVSQKTTIYNKINPRLDSIVVNTRNAIGFRGPELPARIADYLSIITVGGSTTECKFLNDNRTWPYLTDSILSRYFKSLWLDNAGLDGHSTYGHQVLLNDYLVRLHPKVITFLVGVNDIESDEPSFHDKLYVRGAYSDFGHFVLNNSEVINLMVNFQRGWRAQKLNNTTQKPVNLIRNYSLEIPDSVTAKRLANQRPYLARYHERLVQLVDTCLANHIVPVLITQPDLFGSGLDSISGVNLETFKIEPGLNGKLLWQILELYNDVTRLTCSQKDVFLVDLARLMPKNSQYFYDGSHFTNQGAQKVASIVADRLLTFLNKEFPGYRK
ncbi:MAG TPA: SGNH/GDSL hydrolase family protein [Puia sp.]|nr:SGNH/GDSL hydrolase family protein [Puia sp.]